MLYHIFNVYPYYVINLALYLFAFEFILLIVMKCHITVYDEALYIFLSTIFFPGDG